MQIASGCFVYLEWQVSVLIKKFFNWIGKSYSQTQFLIEQPTNASKLLMPLDYEAIWWYRIHDVRSRKARRGCHLKRPLLTVSVLPGSDYGYHSGKLVCCAQLEEIGSVACSARFAMRSTTDATSNRSHRYSLTEREKMPSQLPCIFGKYYLPDRMLPSDMHRSSDGLETLKHSPRTLYSLYQPLPDIATIGIPSLCLSAVRQH